MSSSPTFYQPTGKINILRLPLTFLLLIPVWFLSFLYAGLLHWNPITFLGPVLLFLFIMGLSQVVILGINIAEVQSKKVAVGIAVLFTIMALYFTWAQFLAIWLDSLPVRMLNVKAFWNGLSQLYHEGAYSSFGFTIKGIPGAIIWIVEAILLFAFNISFALDTVEDDVYCTTCRKWVQPVEKFYKFRFADKDKLKELFLSSDFTWLSQTEKVTNSDSDYFRIDTSCCNTCTQANYLSLIKVSREIADEKEVDGTETTEVLLKNIKVDQENFDLLYHKSHHWLHFTESGKFKHSLWLGIPAMALISYGLGWFYQSVSRWAANYFVTGLLFAGLIFVLFFATKIVLERFQSRNSVISNYFGLMVGAIALYLVNMAIFANAEISVWHPDFLWLGVSELNKAHELAGLAWTGFIIESGLLLLIPLFATSYVATDRVYCEVCDEWAHEEDDVLIFQYESAEELIEKFRSQDIEFLENISPVPYTEDKIEYYRINAEWCQTCGSINTLSLEKVKRTYNSMDRVFKYSFTTIFEDLIYTEEHFIEVMNFAKQWQEDLKKHQSENSTVTTAKKD